MAAYARLYGSVWKSDFTDLTHGAQWLYFALISQPDISNAGVLALTRGRWAMLTADTDADSVQSFLDELVKHDKIVVDGRSEELWVRSYMRYDNLAKTNPNGLTSVRRAVAAILSPTLRDLADNELATVVGPVEPTGCPPQQPAASSRDQHPHPAAAAVPDSQHTPNDPDHLSPAAARAIEIIIDHEKRTSAKPVRHAVPFAAKIRGRLLSEHSFTLRMAAEYDDPIDVAVKCGLDRSAAIVADTNLRRAGAA